MQKALKNYRCRLNLRKRPYKYKWLIIFKHGLHFSKPTQKNNKTKYVFL